jgi:aspartate dehydrogenase
MTITTVAVAGAGAIGAQVAAALRRGLPGLTLGAVLDSAADAGARARAWASCDVVVEAASVAAAPGIAWAALAAGCDVVLCSCGALADRDLAATLPAGDGAGRLLIPTGALGGFDILGTASRAEAGRARVRHTTIKGAGALNQGQVTERREIFRGTAREAAIAFPRTSNSSVALALATVGLDQVEAVVVADPEASRTRHVIRFESAIGRYEFTFDNAVDPASGGRTSAITAWSVIDLLVQRAAGRATGLEVTPGVLLAQGAGAR